MSNQSTIEETTNFIWNYNDYDEKKKLYHHLHNIAANAKKVVAANDCLKASTTITLQDFNAYSISQEAKNEIRELIEEVLKKYPDSTQTDGSTWVEQLTTTSFPLRNCYTLLIRFVITSGNAELLHDLLNKGYNTSYIVKEDEGLTALMVSARDGYTSCVQALISANCDVNERDKQGRTALWFASGWGKPNNVKALIEAKADVNIKVGNWTPLLFAARNGRAECTKALIAGKADVNFKDNIGMTATMLAAQYGHIDCLKALIEAKANLNSKSNSKNLHTDDMTALLFALKGGGNKGDITDAHERCAKALIEAGADVNEGDIYDYPPLHFAINRQNYNLVKALIDAHADVNFKSESEGYSILTEAARLANADIVKALINAKAKVDEKVYRGQTALYIAAEKGHLENVKVLIAAGADVNMLCGNNFIEDFKLDWSPLMVASYRGHADIVKTLIDSKATINTKDKRGRTALQRATENGKADVVKVLLAAGANVNERYRAKPNGYTEESNGWSLLMLAAVNGHVEVAKALIAGKADLNAEKDSESVKGDTALILAARNGKTEIVKALVAAGCDKKLTDAKGNTALNIAALYGATDCVKAFIACNTNLNTKNKKGWTPLMLAARNGHTETVQALVNAKAALDIKAKEDGWTALMLAAINGHTSCVKILVNAKAKLNIKNYNGNTALKLAQAYKQIEIYNILKKAQTAVDHIWNIFTSFIGILKTIIVGLWKIIK